MSHGSEAPGRKQKYQEWMSKGVRTKKEMSAYQKGAGKNWKTATNQRSRKPQVNPSPSLITQDKGHRRQMPLKHIPMESPAERKELLREKGVVEKAHKDDEWPEMPMMQTPRRERG